MKVNEWKHEKVVVTRDRKTHLSYLFAGNQGSVMVALKPKKIMECGPKINSGWIFDFLGGALTVSMSKRSDFISSFT